MAEKAGGGGEKETCVWVTGIGGAEGEETWGGGWGWVHVGPGGSPPCGEGTSTDACPCPGPCHPSHSSGEVKAGEEVEEAWEGEEA